MERLWYLGSPYTNHPEGQEIAYDQACSSAAVLLTHGIKVFSPIAHGHSINRYMATFSQTIWLELDKLFLPFMYGMLVLKAPGWEDSAGIAEELEIFKQMEKPIVHLSRPILVSEVNLVRQLEHLEQEKINEHC